MAAPALVALAHGSRDRRTATTVTALVEEVRALRPDLRVEKAFLEGVSRPHFRDVVARLAARGVEEVVVVPLLLTDAPQGDAAVEAATSASRPRSWRCSTCGCARP